MLQIVKNEQALSKCAITQQETVIFTGGEGGPGQRQIQRCNPDSKYYLKSWFVTRVKSIVPVLHYPTPYKDNTSCQQ